MKKARNDPTLDIPISTRTADMGAEGRIGRNIKDKIGAIKGPIDVEQRSNRIEQRLRIGNIEVDLMMGSGHKLALLVMTDRAT